MLSIIAALRVRFYRGMYYCFAQYIPERFAINKIGASVRAFLCRRIFTKCGWGLNCRTHVYFGSGKRLHVGNRSSIGKYSRIYSDTDVYIGDHTDVGPWCLIYTSEPGGASQPPAPVVIGSDVWIGARCIIYPGVTLGNGVIIGAGAVVTDDVSPYSIAGGNPARVLRRR